MIKALEKLGIERNTFQLNKKAIMTNLWSTLYYMETKFTAFPLRAGRRKRFPLSAPCSTQRLKSQVQINNKIREGNKKNANGKPRSISIS